MPALRMTRKVGAPLAVLITSGVLAGLVMTLAGLTSPMLFGLGLIPTLLFFAAAVLAYLWLDRWEPEPMRLLIFAFLWGAGVAAAGALIVGVVFEVAGFTDQMFGIVAEAPVVEEGLKGLLLVIMLTGRRRAEMNTLTDFLVYAGFVGLGFAFVEDLLYLSSTGSVGDTILVGAVRLVLGVFAHPFFTSATAIGLYHAAFRARTTGMRILYGLGGYVGAMTLHAIWNGSASLGLAGYLLVYVCVSVPLFAGLVVLAIRSRRSEGTRLNLQLPRLVAEGLIVDREAAWLATLPSRRARFAVVKSVSGPRAAAQVRHFCDAVTELAIVRDTVARGQARPDSHFHELELVGSVQLERAVALPFLIEAARHVPEVAIQQYRSPVQPQVPQPPTAWMMQPQQSGWGPPRQQPGWGPQQPRQPGWGTPLPPPPSPWVPQPPPRSQ